MEIELLYQRFSPLVFSIGLSVLKSREEAEDIVQDVFAHKVEKLVTSYPNASIEEMGRLIARSAKNLCIDKYRRKQRFPETQMDEAYIRPEAPEEIEEKTEKLKAALSRLDEDSKEVLTLKYFAKMTWEQVAKRIGLSEQGARKRGTKAKNLLAKEYERDAEE